MCGRKHRAGSDSEMLFPLSKNMKGGIPYSGTLLLSLATEKEEMEGNTQLATLLGFDFAEIISYNWSTDKGR
jgi:hypothetical protein